MKKVRLIIPIVLLFFIYTSCSINSVPANTNPTVNLDDVVDVVSPPPPVPDPVNVEMVAVGDNLIHDSIYKQASARNGNGSYDFSYVYKNIAEKISAADISVINQETIISAEHKPSSYPMFNSPPELGDEMVKVGFDVFNIANNHSLDKGEKGLLNAIEFWKQKEVVLTGAFPDEAASQVIPTQTVNDITFSYIGITELTNGLSLPKNSPVILMLGQDETRIKATIEKAKTVSDVVVVCIHWGNEYTNDPTQRQRDLAQKMSDWGVDLIIGHHPHVIQPIEWLTSASGDQTLVIYSLGNFVSAQDKGARMIGGLVKMNFQKEYKNNTVSITSAKFEGVITHYDSGFKNIRVYPFADYTKELASSHGVRKYSSEFNYNYIVSTIERVIPEEFRTVTNQTETQ